MDSMFVLNKKALASQVAEKMDLKKKDVAEVIDAVFEEITLQLQDNKGVDITGFGKFEVIERAAREGINPSTKERIMIAATKSPKFKASKALKDAVKN